MTGTEPVWTAILSDTRARAAVAARRYGVPPTMIAAAAQRRAVGDWRGACAAADVDVYLNPDDVRRRYGAAISEQLLAALRDLVPDVLRWHLPRCGHGAGELLAGLLVPLAEFRDGDRVLTLVAMTPQVALDAGEQIVLTVLESAGPARPFVGADPVTRALLGLVRVRQAGRHSLVRHPEFWSAAKASGLAAMVDATAEAQDIARLQDAGDFAEAWQAAGFELVGDPLPSRTRWLAALPVRLPGLADRVRTAVPGVDAAALRSGVGAVELSGLNSAGPVVARVVSKPDLPTVPTAVWARSLDVDLLRCGAIGAQELHPLVAAALGERPSAPEPDEWLYREVPFIGGPCPDADIPTLWIQCGADAHRVAHHDGTWRPLDHPGNAGREALFRRLGGPADPCGQAVDYLATGRHVIDLIESLLRHGRAVDVRRLIRGHASARTVLNLPGGSTVHGRLAALRENTLHLRMLLAAAARPRDPWTLDDKTRPRARKGVPARTHR